MKRAFRLYQHKNGYFYVHNNSTNKQTSLHTKHRGEAERLLEARNAASNSTVFAKAMGEAYLSVVDEAASSRTWADVMDLICQRGTEATQDRAARAFCSGAFRAIKGKAVLATTSSDLIAVASHGSSAVHYMKVLHGAALDLGWLYRPILGRKMWLKHPVKERRGITRDEHDALLAKEASEERRNYYEMLWHTGASQTDGSRLSQGNVDWGERVITYIRAKTGEQCCIRIGNSLEALLHALPSGRWFFPKLSGLSPSDRAAEFSRRCATAGVSGVSLHSYRYAWAERAYSAGYPERYAQAALGHSSKAVHHAYARKARVICPSLEDYEEKVISLRSSL